MFLLLVFNAGKATREMVVKVAEMSADSWFLQTNTNELTDDVFTKKTPKTKH